MKNYLRLLSTFKKHLTILCMTYCGLNLWRLVSMENVKCNQVNLFKLKVKSKV